MHQVLISNRGQEELDNSHVWWALHRSVEQANRWYVGFVQVMLGLEENPERHPLAPESGLFPNEVRQLNYGVSGRPTHRALFTIHNDQVVILRIRHLAQQRLSAEDI